MSKYKISIYLFTHQKKYIIMNYDLTAMAVRRGPGNDMEINFQGYLNRDHDYVNVWYRLFVQADIVQKDELSSNVSLILTRQGTIMKYARPLPLRVWENEQACVAGIRNEIPYNAVTVESVFRYPRDFDIDQFQRGSISCRMKIILNVAPEDLPRMPRKNYFRADHEHVPYEVL